MVATNTVMECSGLAKMEVASTLFKGGNEGDVFMGLVRPLGGNCWRL